MKIKISHLLKNGIIGSILAFYLLFKVATVDAAVLSPETPIRGCGELEDDNGVYTIDSSFTIASGDCFIVRAHNVTIKGSGSPVITGNGGNFIFIDTDPGTGDLYGFNATTTIQDLTASGFNKLLFAEVQSGSIGNVVIKNVTGAGVFENILGDTGDSFGSITIEDSNLDDISQTTLLSGVDFSTVTVFDSTVGTIASGSDTYLHSSIANNIFTSHFIPGDIHLINSTSTIGIVTSNTTGLSGNVYMNNSFAGYVKAYGSGNISISDSNVTGIVSNQFSNGAYRGEHAGNIEVGNSIVGGINASSAYGYSGNISVSNSIVNSDVNTVADGSISIASSTVEGGITIGSLSNPYLHMNNGDINVSNSTVGDVANFGSIGVGNYDEGNPSNGTNSGNIIIANSSARSAATTGGYGIGGNGGNSGDIFIENSSISTRISSAGGYSSSYTSLPGNAGDITIIDSNFFEVVLQPGINFSTAAYGTTGDINISGEDMNIINPSIWFYPDYGGSLTINGSFLLSENEEWIRDTSTWQGDITWKFTDSSKNNGTLNGNAEFRDVSENTLNGSVSGVCDFYDDSINSGYCATVSSHQGYFFIPGLDSNWENPDNWYTDSDGSNPLGYAPTTTTETVFLAGTTTGPISTTTVGNIKVASPTTGGGFFGIDISKVIGFTSASFFDSSYTTGIINGVVKLFSSLLGGSSSVISGENAQVKGDIEFYNDTYNDIDNTTENKWTGIARFFDSSGNESIIDQAEFYDVSSNKSSGTVFNAEMNENSFNLGTLFSAIFNDESYNDGEIDEEATFKSGTFNRGTSIGDLRFEGDSYNIGTTTNATFLGDYSENFFGGSGFEVVEGTNEVDWSKIIELPNGDVYALASDNNIPSPDGSGSGIFKQVGGVGPFIKVDSDYATWSDILYSPIDGDVYASSNSGVYKQTGGVGPFEQIFNVGVSKMLLTPNGDIYIFSGYSNLYVYKKVNGSNDFVLQFNSVANDYFSDSVYRPNGESYDIYFGINNGKVYKQTNGTGGFVAQTSFNLNNPKLYSINGNVYALADRIYKQTNGTGLFVSKSGVHSWNDMISTPSGDIYAINNMQLFKQASGTDTFTLVDLGGINAYSMYKIIYTKSDDIYILSGGGVLKQEGATGPFEYVFSSSYYSGWTDIINTQNDDLYLTKSDYGAGKIYKLTQSKQGVVTGIKTRLYNALNEQVSLTRSFVDSAWTIVADNTLVKLLYRNLINIFGENPAASTTLVEQNGGVIIAPISVSENATSTSITDCGVLDQNGMTYVLENDISNFKFDTCFVVKADNVTIDGNHKILDGSGVSEKTAIISSDITNSNDSLNAYTNLTVKNITITDFDVSVDARGILNQNGKGGNGGNISIDNSVIGSMYTNGANGTISGGSGGNVSLAYTSVTSGNSSTTISTDGGNSTSCGNGGDAGIITATDSEFEEFSSEGGSYNSSSCPPTISREQTGQRKNTSKIREYISRETYESQNNNNQQLNTPSSGSNNRFAQGQINKVTVPVQMLKPLVFDKPLPKFGTGEGVFSFIQPIQKFFAMPMPQSFNDKLANVPKLADYLKSIGLSTAQSLVNIQNKPITLAAAANDIEGIWSAYTKGLPVRNSNGEFVTISNLPISSVITGNKTNILYQKIKVAPKTNFTVALASNLESAIGTFNGKEIYFTKSGNKLIANITVPRIPGVYNLTTGATPLVLSIEVEGIVPTQTVPVQQGLWGKLKSFFSW